MNHHPTPLPARRRAPGFSVVELMVSVVIGMLALMFATRLIVGAEQNKQASLGGSDSMQNGMLAMFSISGDAAQAGFGLNDKLLVGCETQMTDTSGFALATATRAGAAISLLAPVVIESNGANPDRISLYSGSSMSGTGTLRLMAAYAGGSRIDVDRVPYGFSKGDVIVVAPETIGAGKCALGQISADPATLAPPPAQQSVFVASGSDQRFNTAAGLGVNFASGMARLFNLGPAKALSFHTWSVADGFLQLRSTDLAGSGTAASSVADNIVSIKAQYGFDTAGGKVWSSDMAGAGLTGIPADYARISSLRLAVVARSKNPEKPNAAGTCTATPTAPTVFGSAQQSGVAAVPVTVNVGVTGDPVDWKCYRYRVFETIVPIRNASWSPV